jgi:hypothetical protein
MDSISELLKKTNHYSWSFHSGYKPGMISCIAFSVVDARKQIRDYFDNLAAVDIENKKIIAELSLLDEKLLKVKRDFQAKFGDQTALEASINVLLKKQRDLHRPDVQNLIGCFCGDIFSFNRDTIVRSDENNEITCLDG